ncbi:hypothetical protein [Xanthomonas campestris]|uniref:hypothetical protein n=1 Tax=Xanthomonas TaxID=338 RepID=UPI001E4FDDDF|nr:hypothetical protein [Xanthomonas campestris]MCC5091265.1 hypothetical protein [Xanthomonas campestris]
MYGIQYLRVSIFKTLETLTRRVTLMAGFSQCKLTCLFTLLAHCDFLQRETQLISHAGKGGTQLSKF